MIESFRGTFVQPRCSQSGPSNRHYISACRLYDAACSIITQLFLNTSGRYQIAAFLLWLLSRTFSGPWKWPTSDACARLLGRVVLSESSPSRQNVATTSVCGMTDMYTMHPSNKRIEDCSWSLRCALLPLNAASQPYYRGHL